MDCLFALFSDNDDVVYNTVRAIVIRATQQANSNTKQSTACSVSLMLFIFNTALTFHLNWTDAHYHREEARKGWEKIGRRVRMIKFSICSSRPRFQLSTALCTCALWINTQNIKGGLQLDAAPSIMTLSTIEQVSLVTRLLLIKWKCSLQTQCW